jgi:hypothetical protein
VTYDEWIDDALGLFLAEEAKLTPPPTPPGIWGAVDTKWTRYKLLTHRPCDACTELIHERGTGKAPHPQPAAWRRKGPNGERLLCNAHGEEHKRLDDQVTAEHKEREAMREHQVKGRRS